MPRLSDEQITQARNIDVLDYLQTYEPGTVRKCGANEHCLVEHDSFKMSNNKWFWWSRDFGGYSALDFLVKVRGLHFVDAVKSLTDGMYFSSYHENDSRKDNNTSYKTSPPPKLKPKAPPKPQKPFTLPKAHRNADRVIAYLRGRGISKEIINRCIKAGILYESTARRCVFVGKDGNIPKFACERGTTDDWKKDVAGSNKQFSFTLPPENPNSQNLIVTESPIDCLAHFSIHELGQTGFDGHRLSLGGVSSLALTSFLERNPQISNIQLCLDNDKAGMEATNRIIKELLSDRRYGNIKITVAPPPIGKDYTDTLQAIQQLNMKQHKSNRSHEAVF